jgi:RNA recognition motif-containing protein
MDIEISNIHLNVIEADLRRLFTPFGEVTAVELKRDKWSNRSTGHAFVTMPVEKEANAAIEVLHRTMLSGKPIMVTKSNSSELQNF